jgi:hypothetical protein
MLGACATLKGNWLLLLQEEMNVKVLILQNGQNPDDLLKLELKKKLNFTYSDYAQDFVL